MKKKSLLFAFVGVALAASMSTSIVARAGINTNQPFGEGLIKDGDVNSVSFIEFDETDAIKAQNGNGTLTFNNAAWRGVLMSHNNPIPKADLTEGTKVVLQYDVYNLGTMWSQCFYASPFAGLGDWGQNHMTMRINTNCVQGYSAPAGSEVWIKGAKVFDNSSAMIGIEAGTNEGDFGLQANVLNGQKEKGNDHCTYWLEYDVGTTSLTLYGGNAETNEKTEYATVKNAFTLSGADNYYMNFAYDDSYEIDNVKVYSVKGGETKTYLDCGFDSVNDYMIGGSSAEEDRHKLVLVDSGGTSSLKTYDTVVTVTNPAETARITTVNKLAVDAKLDVTFELNATYRLNAMSADRKIGIALGLDGYRTSLASPAKGASFVYLTKNAEGAIVLGAENIDENGAVTTISESVLTDKTETSDVALSLKGRKDGSVDVAIGEETYNFAGIKANGHVSFAQTGTGAATYSLVVDKVNLTGYELRENEGTAQTASFDNNYISTAKFALQNTVAPEAYLTKQETSAHAPNGITVENGKVGFYGSSTNTRLMFKEKYADFVLQFDYISEPVATRYLPSGLPGAGSPNRYSPLYVLFGAENECPELSSTYAYGIIEGNMTQYFWGAESLITKEGKAGSGLAAVTSGMTRLEANEDGAIPCYYAPNELGYGKPNNSLYSFYNKTTRVKLVVVNNHVAMYAAEVGTDGTAGEYTKLFELTVSDSYGNVGFGTDAPSWAAIDNVAITPIETSKVIELGLNAVPAVDLVKDVAVADMANDSEPKPLAKAVVTVNAEAKKATWTAVEGAKEYEVVVKAGTEEKLRKTVTATEIDLSSLTEAGDYKIRVTAVPADENNFLKSNSAEAIYTVKGSETTSDPAESTETSVKDSGTESKAGCFGAIGTEGVFAALLAAGAVAVFARRKENN